MDNIPLNGEEAPEVSPTTPKEAQDEEMYAVSRLDVDKHGQNAWAIHLSRGGRMISMTFSDSTYGGVEQALYVAKSYRDAVLKVVPPMTNQELRMQIRKNRPSDSDVPGVYYVAPCKHYKDGAWIARIEVARPGGANRSTEKTGKRSRHAMTRTFNIGKHGYDQARKMAEDERIRMLLSISNGDGPVLRSPTAIAVHQTVSQMDCAAEAHSPVEQSS